ncbi:MAG: ATP-dependent DNA helicase RecG [Candidatus Pacebacteria bacterium]|nr:ATP-dependent DNA helicase RecG [Candidatus Paceibacterota bacterium]
MDLQTPLERIFEINSNQKLGLKKLQIFTISDLLYYFPIRYGDFNRISYIRNIKKGDAVNIYAVVKSIKTKESFRAKLTMTEAILEETTGDKIKAIWFSQPYISKMLKIGTSAKFSGMISENSQGIYITNPEFEKKGIPIEKTGSLFEEKSKDQELTIFPVYRETKYITSKWIFHKIKKILSNKNFLKNLNDPIPEKILKKYSLPSLKNSFFYLHLPKEYKQSEVAKKRFAFEEIFFIQIVKNIERQKYRKSGAFTIKPTKETKEKFKKFFDFEFTDKQKDAIKDIENDFKSGEPESRLIEGDVGSGKTVVAMAASYFTVKTKPKNQSFGKLQVAYMAPTEILAIQIFNEFSKIFKNQNINIGLLTSKNTQKFPSKTNKNESTKISKKKLLEWTLNGEIQILIGTHALISKNVFFENLGLVIIDEQHRFGKNQRAKLRAKPKEKKEKIKSGGLKKSEKIIKKGLAENEDILPHLISMTATPIPRTLALSIYGDLNLTIIDELPKGRKKVNTEVFIDNETSRKDVYKKAKEKLDEGRQMFIICPRISDPDPNKERALNVKSAISVTEETKKNPYFKNYKIGLLHSKLKKEEKIQIMQNFLDNKIQILVSTSVIEVGVSVKNATVIIIEGAERFGLSQLHQFRGRIARSSFQPYCFAFANTKNEDSLKRLKIFKTVSDGFELAEHDLQTRGAGEILGNKQSGISDLAMEAIKNLKLVEAARNEAQNLIKNNLYKKEKNLLTKLEDIREKIYLE